MKQIYTFLLTLLVVGFVHGQKFENAQFLQTITTAEITATLGIPVAYDVNLYKVSYQTADVNGMQHTASGLICIPEAENTSFPLVCYQHGTVNGREDVPSRLQGGYELALAFSAFGYIVCAADFVGLGDSPGVHPYVHAETEASAGVDLLLAAYEMSEDEDYPPFIIGDQLFLGGYSQGGHASMAAHRLVEESYAGTFNVAATAHMSGPYSISEKMVEFTLGDQEYATVSYLPWLVLGYQSAYPELLKDIELEDVFKEVYIEDIIAFRDEEITLGQLNSRLSFTLLDSVGGVFPKEMLKEDILNAILTDPTHPISQALADNDTYDWAPQAPTNIYYCVGDDQVTYENAVLAESVMISNGASAVQALQMDGSFPLDHGQCIAPVVTSVLFFFGSLQDISTSNDNLLAQNQIKSYAGADHLVTEIPFGAGTGLTMAVYDMTGNRVMLSPVNEGMSLHNIAELYSGMYVVNIMKSGDLLHSNKIVIP